MRQADLFQHRGSVRFGLAALHAADQQRHGDVFQRGEFRQQVMELVDEAERAVAQFAALRLAHLLHFLPEDLRRCRRWLVQSAEQMQQGALAGTGSADDGDALAALHFEVDAVQHRHIQLPCRWNVLRRSRQEITPLSTVFCPLSSGYS